MSRVPNRQPLPTIESDIPPPKYDRISWAPTLRRMKIGQSFVLPVREPSRGYAAINAYGRRHGLKFKVRKTKEGFRCWRVK